MSNAVTDETELKPCPFCGGNAIRCGNNDINPRHWVMCRDCHACPGGDVPDLAAAETAWNSREPLTTQKDIQPVAWLRPGEYVPIQNCPYGAMWISDKDDPRAFPVYTNAPAAIDAIAIIEARLPLYTDIGQINALRECISSIRSAAFPHPPVQVPVVKALRDLIVHITNSDDEQMTPTMRSLVSAGRSALESSAPVKGETEGRERPELFSESERKDILADAEALWRDLQGNNLGGFSGGNRPFYILHAFKTVIEKYGKRDVGLTWSKNDLDAPAAPEGSTDDI